MLIELEVLQILEDHGFEQKDPLIGGQPVPASAIPYIRVRRDKAKTGNVYADIFVLDWLRFDGRAKLSLQGFEGTAREPNTMTSLYRSSMAVISAEQVIDREMFRMLHNYEDRVMDYDWGELVAPVCVVGDTLDEYLHSVGNIWKGEL